MADVRKSFRLLALVLAASAVSVQAQSQLGGHKPPGSSLGGGNTGTGGPGDLSSLKPPVPKPGATPPPPSLQPPASHPPPGKPAPMVTPQAQTGPAPMSTARFQTLRAGDRVVDLRTASDGEVLTGKSGRTITVGRIKELQAAMESAKPVVVAKPGQSLASLSSAPAGTRVRIGNRTVRADFLAKVQSLRAKLSVKRTPKPMPNSLQYANAKADGVLGQNGLTIAAALKRPGNEVIQVGSRKYSAEQLRQIDAALRASKREPLGLAERAAAMNKGMTRASIAPKGPSAAGPRLAVTKTTPIQQMLAKPDDTVLQSPSGKTVTVGQVKQYLAREKLTPEQLGARFAKGAK
jgi:hypothetical protein